MSEEGVVKLGCFGISEAYYVRDVDENTMCNSSMYMAPEVFEDSAVLKSDVWSLGMSVIEMIEGKNPYAGMTYAEFKEVVLNNPPPSLTSSGWSNALVDFVKKCLVKDVNERWSADELLEVSVGVLSDD